MVLENNFFGKLELKEKKKLKGESRSSLQTNFDGATTSVEAHRVGDLGENGWSTIRSRHTLVRVKVVNVWTVA